MSITPSQRLPLHVTEITVCGITFTVNYCIHGQHMAATETDPAEYPDAVLDSVCIADEDLIAVLSDSVLEKIEEELQELIK